MFRHAMALLALVLVIATTPTPGIAQGHPDPSALLAAQREAMQRFAMMDGAWRGSAWMQMPSGERREFTQTERVGPFLDGAVRVIEGRGYDADGSVSFNAFGIVSFDPATQTYSMRSYAMGRIGDFAITPTGEGFQWEIPAGPMSIRYTAVITEGTWHETGDQIRPGQEPVRFLEMTLSRIDDSTWPAAGAIEPD